MKILGILVSLLLSLSIFVECASDSNIKEGDFLGNPSINYRARLQNSNFGDISFEKPNYDTITLENGLIAYFIKNDSLPLLKVSAYYKMGKIYESASESNSSALISSLLAEGGTKSYPIAEIHAFEDETSTIFSSSIDRERALVHFNALYDPDDPSEDEKIQKCFSILNSMITEPAFEAEELRRVKIEIINNLMRAEDDPSEISRRELTALIYGDNHPIAVKTDPQSIIAITAKQLQEIYNALISPKSTVLAISGNISKEKVISFMRKAFGDWESLADKGLGEVPQPLDLSKTKVYYYPKDLTQSTVVIARPSLKYDNPDYAALYVANQIYGGSGFSSRLYNTIRSDKGLSYYVGSNFYAFSDVKGYFYTIVKTRANATINAIQSVMKELHRMKTSLVSDQELIEAKENFLNSFVFFFENLFSVVTRAANYKILGLSANFHYELKDKIAAVTKEDVLKAAQSYFIPESSVIMVIGNEASFEAPLSSLGLGEVQTLSPPPYLQK